LAMPPREARWQEHRRRWKGLMPGVPSMTDREPPTRPGEPARGADQRPPIDRNAVQYLDRVRAIFRPANSDALAAGLERFIGKEGIFRHIGMADTAHGTQTMMQSLSPWPNHASWGPIGGLERLEILEDQDVRS